MHWHSFIVGFGVAFYSTMFLFVYWHMSGFVLTRLRNSPDPTWVGGVRMHILAKTFPRPTPQPPHSGVNVSFQNEVGDWVLRTFGQETADNITERGLRFFEEATELAQSVGLKKHDCQALVDYVFDRPGGHTKQEVGGVMICLAALCNAASISLRECQQAELIRIWHQVEHIRAKHLAKQQAGIAVPSETMRPENPQ